MKKNENELGMEFINVGEFEIQDSPVTQEQWINIMWDNPSRFRDRNCPVESVSYDDVQDFIKKLNKELNDKYIYRLPTEKEWEYAASCNGKFKDPKDITKYAWMSENSKERTHPVKQLKPNKWGLYDVLGNVWEWTETKEGSNRVFRGGGWSNSSQGVRLANRDYWRPDNRSPGVGFRLIRSKV